MIRSFQHVDRRLPTTATAKPVATTTTTTTTIVPVVTSAEHHSPQQYQPYKCQDRKDIMKHTGTSTGNCNKILILLRHGCCCFVQERGKEKRYAVLVTTSKLYRLLLLFSGCFVVSTFWNHSQRELLPVVPSQLQLPPMKPQIEQGVKTQLQIPVTVGHDLDMFIPLKNASTTFALDNFHFIVLHDRVLVESTDSSLEDTAIRWTVPNITDSSNYLPTPMLQSTINRTKYMNQLNICQVVCQFDEVSFAIVHFPHFLQQALPCYSIFHYMANMIRIGHPPTPTKSSQYALRNYMVLPGKGRDGKFSPYIQNVIRVMEGPPYYVQMIYGFNESIPVHEDCHTMSVGQQQQPPLHSDRVLSSNTKPSNALLAIKAFADTGWDTPNRYFLSSDATFKKNTSDALQTNKEPTATGYCYESYELIQQIQQSVLGMDQYHARPSLFDHDDQYGSTSTTMKMTTSSNHDRILQVLILDRKSSSRDFEHVNDTIRVLHNYRFNHSGIFAKGSIDRGSSKGKATTRTTTLFRLNVTYIPSFNGYTLYEQAYIMHHADIIYSPHGAQLSNLIYIRPCTVIVEFFPRAYYVQFFQPLAVSAKGISYEAYPTATMHFTDKVTDSLLTSQNYEVQKVVRGVRINVQSNFFLRTLPQLLDATIQCRSNYFKKM